MQNETTESSAMSSQDLERPLTFRLLHESPVVTVRDYRCASCRGGPSKEESSDSNNIVLLRRGVFCKHHGRRDVSIDVNQAAFFSKGSPYRVSHPAECGDRGTVFTLAPDVLCDIVGEIDPASADHPERPFLVASGPCDAAAFRQHRALTLQLESCDAREPLEIEEKALQLMARVLKAAHAPRMKTRRRTRTGIDHAERAESAKSYLASRIGERITLSDAAGAANASPFHFSRLFLQHTGMPVHRYLTLLRLRASIEWLLEGTADLAVLALELGFSSHSHFTSAFRSEFGCPPSGMRKCSRTLREMSNILKA